MLYYFFHNEINYWL